MPRRLRWPALVLLGAVLLVARAGTAQGPTPEPADTRAARLAFLAEDSLAGDEVAARRATRRAWMAAQHTDTVTIGDIRWHVAPSLRSVVEPALREVDTTLRRRGVPTMAVLLNLREAYIVADAPPKAGWVPGLRRGRPTLLFSEFDVVNLFPLDRATLTNVLDVRLHAPIWIRADRALKRWAASAPSQFAHSVFDVTDLRQMLIGGDDARGPRCASGDLGACRGVLLDTTLAGRAYAGPLRASLISMALATGGPHAMTRLLADSTAPIPTRLESAGTQPLDTLIAAWHRGYIVGEPDHPFRSAVLALGFAAVLSTLGLRRTA